MKKKWYDLTVLGFFRKHLDCDDGRKWALSTGAKTMRELWKRDDIRPNRRIWIATRSGVLDHIMLVRFACFCARQNWDALTDERSKKAIETLEAFCRGEATQEECKFAADAAYAAARSAAYAADAAYAAARSAAYAAAYAAACTAACTAARSAAYAADAAYAAARSAADAAACTAARAVGASDAIEMQQAQWLFDNVKAGG